MSKNPGVFAFMHLYWEVTWKWFLGLVAGMAALELGLLTFYINGGHRYLFFRDENNNKFWPTEYRGALQSIRLEYILPVFAVILLFFLVLTFNSLNNQQSSKLAMRIPVSPQKQVLYRIGHSFIMIVSTWLVQFLILIAGFLLYRNSAPEGLNIDIQLFMVFAPPGRFSSIYPIINAGFLILFLPGFLILTILPVFIADTIQKATTARSISIVVLTLIAGFLITKAPPLAKLFMLLILMAFVLSFMILCLFSRLGDRLYDHDVSISSVENK